MSSLTMGRTRKIKRILIASYGNALVPELMKLLEEKKYCLFILFGSPTEISTVQKGLGKKRMVPVLMDEVLKSKDVSEELLKSLPTIDAVINLINSQTVAKFYEKRKRYNTTEVKIHKTKASDLKNVLDAANEPCLINLIPETTIGFTHMFDPNGIDVPITTHLSTSLRNSIRKLFPRKATLSMPLSDSNSAAGPSSSTNAAPRSFSLKLRTSHAKSVENVSKSENQIEGAAAATRKPRRSLSFLRKKKPPEGESIVDPIAFARNLIWEKENASLKKSMNKLHAEHGQRFHKSLKKLNSTKSKKQKSAEKVIEEEMSQEKGKLEGKCSELNATTLSRASALTPATANRIIASREVQINKEVCRNANKKKSVEFEKIEESHNEKLRQLKNKHHQDTVKAQLELLHKTTIKYHEKFLQTDQKSIQRSGTVT